MSSDKPSVPKRLLNITLGNVNPEELGDGLIRQVIIPRIKGLLFDIVTEAAGYVFLGTPITPQDFYTVNRTSTRALNTTATGYNNIYLRNNNITSGGYPKPIAIEFENSASARNALKELKDAIRVRGYATVEMLYLITGADKPSPMDSQFGWTTLGSNVKISANKNGLWVLTMPNPVKILR